MSETKKGMLVWMTTLGVARPHGTTLSTTRSGNHTRPVYILPLDPDGPLPGQEWMFQGAPVTVSHPLITVNSKVHYWIRYANGTHGGVAPQHLSPIPSTRTVTVELTEREIEQLGKLASLTLSSAERKLVKALEDS